MEILDFDLDRESSFSSLKGSKEALLVFLKGLSMKFWDFCIFFDDHIFFQLIEFSKEFRRKKLEFSKNLSFLNMKLHRHRVPARTSRRQCIPRHPEGHKCLYMSWKHFFLPILNFIFHFFIVFAQVSDSKWPPAVDLGITQWYQCIPRFRKILIFLILVRLMRPLNRPKWTQNIAQSRDLVQ